MSIKYSDEPKDERLKFSVTKAERRLIEAYRHDMHFDTISAALRHLVLEGIEREKPQSSATLVKHNKELA